jgi:hypothetical protein
MTMRTLAAAVSICVVLGVQGVASAAAGDELYARPGQLVAAQGTRLNFYCMGRGSPAVVFDSGWGDWAPVWMIVQPEVAREQAKWLELSSNARQLFTDQSSEYIPFDQPGFVVDAIREAYTQSK